MSFVNRIARYLITWLACFHINKGLADGCGTTGMAVYWMELLDAFWQVFRAIRDRH
jgi:hypothetical protein